MTSAHDSPITLAHHLQRSNELLSQETGSEAVLLDPTGENYFGVDRVGRSIRNVMEGHALLGNIDRQRYEAFEVDTSRIMADLIAMTTDLLGARLVKRA